MSETDRGEWRYYAAETEFMPIGWTRASHYRRFGEQIVEALHARSSGTNESLETMIKDMATLLDESHFRAKPPHGIPEPCPPPVTVSWTRIFPLPDGVAFLSSFQSWNDKKGQYVLSIASRRDERELLDALYQKCGRYLAPCRSGPDGADSTG